jgi:hypothetical protein
MYRALAVPNILPHNHAIWKLKLPLKVKVFIWYLIKGVVLTKDNLVKRRWKGSLKCCCCNIDESIQHLFFDCTYARLVWRIIQVSFNISPPLNIQHMFNGWVQGIDKKIMYKILIGACTLRWAMWLSQNDVFFDKVRVFNPMQVIFRGTHWIRHWSLLQKEEDRPQIKWGCHVRVLEMVTMEIFATNGWNFSNPTLEIYLETIVHVL